MERSKMQPMLGNRHTRSRRRQTAWALACLLAITSAIVVESASARGRKYALLLGINDYQRSSIPALSYAEKDVEDLEQALDRHGFDPIVAFTADRVDRSLIIAELYKASDQLDQDDLFLLFFAGHGAINRRNIGTRQPYWLTYDTDLDFLDDRGMRLGHLLDYVNDIPARQKVLLLDHCYGGMIVLGPGDSGGGLEIGAPARGSDPQARPAESARARQLVSLSEAHATARTSIENLTGGTLIIAASAGAAWEYPDLEHGLFTQAILNALNTPVADTQTDGRLTAAELAAFLGQEVTALSDTLQKPIIGGGAINTHEWILSDRIVFEDPNVIIEKYDRFVELVEDWYDQGLISAQVKIRCKSILKKWKNASGGPGALAPGELEVITHLETLDQGLKEEEVAEELEDVVQDLIGD